MRITVIGTGYVGLVTGVCLADLGNTVACVDIDEDKIRSLQRGRTTIYEPGLQERLERGLREERLSFTTELRAALKESELVFICVGTPARSDGHVDLSFVEAAVRSVGELIEHEFILVMKSTVPVGTAARTATTLTKQLRQRQQHFPLHVVSNPEFLREGAAVNDFFNPDRIIVGVDTDDQFARQTLERLYQSVARAARPIVFMDPRSAELTKYASNAMLAARISFMNELSGYCEKVGADITAVAKGMGLDGRIGPRFLQAGIGYGGSCFPKDVQGLISALTEEQCPATLFSAIHEVNERQKQSLFPKIKSLLGSVKGARVAIWGLSFKPRTDDTRDAPSRVVVSWLLEQGASVAVFDPEAMAAFRRDYPTLHYASTPYDALTDADLLILLTEWDEFRNPDWARVKSLLRAPKLIDGRNIYHAQRDELSRLGFAYVGVGVPLNEAE